MNSDQNSPLFLSELLYQAIDGVYQGRDKDILLRRFGLNEGGSQTLREVGLAQGISYERVRQLEQKIIHKLRAAWKTTIKLPAYNLAAVKFKEALDLFLKEDQDNFNERLRSLLDVEFADLNPDMVKLLVDVAYKSDFRPKVLRKEKVRKSPKQEEHLILKIEGLLGHFNWPANCTFDCINRAEKYNNPVREMGRTSLGNTGSYFSLKLQREIIYESTLEHKFFLTLEQSEEVILYREQPMSLPYQLLGEPRKYVPDVFIVFKDGRGAICEIKDDMRMALYESLCKYEALCKYCEENGLGYCMTDGRFNFEHYKMQTNLSEHIETAWLTALETGTLNLDDFKKLKEKAYLTNVSFRALILKHNLIWLRSPFRLSKGEMIHRVAVDQALEALKIISTTKLLVPKNETVPIDPKEETKVNALKTSQEENSSKQYSLEAIRNKHPKAYIPWTREEDDQLKDEFLKGLQIKELAKLFQRQSSAIRARLKKVGVTH